MTKTSPDNRCTPVSEWPALDREAWLGALEPRDRFSPAPELATRWKQSTQISIANGYGRWLGWLDRRRMLEPRVPPGARATRDTVRTYCEALQNLGLADYTIAGRINQLGKALSVMEPDSDFGWINRAASRLFAKAKPRRDVRAIMQPPEAILALGLDLMQEADEGRFRTHLDRATLFRDGLMLCLLVQRPLRLANLTELTLGRDLEFYDAWRIRIEDDQTKSGRAIECDWPSAIAAHLERYLAVHRPALLKKRPSDLRAGRLWISKQGGPMTAAAVAYQVGSRTKDQFGSAINPHSFRHIAATAIATADPTHSAAIAGVLGHSSLSASEKYYNRAQVLGAAERMHAGLDNFRSGDGR